MRTKMTAILKQQEEFIKQVKVESQTALAMLDGNSTDELLLIRGNSKTPGKPVSHQFLEAIAGTQQDFPAQSSGRLELAGKISSRLEHGALNSPCFETYSTIVPGL